MWRANSNWRTLDLQTAFLAEYFARVNAGSSMAARMAMMATTTSSSIKVKPDAPPALRFNPHSPPRAPARSAARLVLMVEHEPYAWRLGMSMTYLLDARP